MTKPKKDDQTPESVPPSEIELNIEAARPSLDQSIEAINMDKLATVYPEAVDPYMAILQKVDSLSNELKARSGTEARGLAWTYVHALVDDNAGEEQLLTICLSSRSDIDTVSALNNLMEAIKHGKDTYNLQPFKPRAILPIANTNRAPQPVNSIPAPVILKQEGSTDEPEF